MKHANLHDFLGCVHNINENCQKKEFGSQVHVVKMVLYVCKGEHLARRQTPLPTSLPYCPGTTGSGSVPADNHCQHDQVYVAFCMKYVHTLFAQIFLPCSVAIGRRSGAERAINKLILLRSF